LLRKLCEDCKQPLEPGEKLRTQLGLPTSRVEVFYRPPPVPQNPKEICAACGGLGYRGRTAIFELLVINDEMRRILAKTPKLDLLRAAAHKAKHIGLQQEGSLLLAQGVTSVAELSRVLKQ
jgi:type II secretory ATPase GspE/PulE/Tfp pilus assembly ATPase PilB-like protein